MLKFGIQLVRLSTCMAATLWAGAAFACNVPVFRYALERWEADPYEVVVFQDAPLEAERQSAVAMLQQNAQDRLANVSVRLVNLAGDLSPAMQKLWAAQKSPSAPWIVARYPRQTGFEAPAWAGRLEAKALASLLESPVRRDITQKLLHGDAVVWLLLESGDAGRDDAAAKLLETELRQLEKSLVLPERTELDPPINPDLPLKIAFSMVRLARTDPAERMLTNLLLNWNTNLTAATETMLFPIFGRGRVVPPAIGKEIRPEAIRDMAEFLTGPCSCEVKETNPGYDLLLSANWGSVPGYEEVMLPAPSSLVGMSQFAEAAATNSATLAKASGVALAVAPSGPRTAPAGQRPLTRNAVVVLGLSVLFLTVATLVIRAKTNRGPQ